VTVHRHLLPTLAVLATLAAGLVATGDPSAADGPVRSVSVSGTGVSTYPTFDPAVTRYGIRTGADTAGSITVTASTSDPVGRVLVNGRTVTSGAPVTVDGLVAGDEIAVRIEDEGGAASYGYVVLPAEFPALTATSAGVGPADGLVFLGLIRFFPGPTFNAVVDDNGVPAYLDATGAGNDFKLQPDGRYSEGRTTTTPGRLGERIIARDASFAEVASYETVGLVNTDFHDSIFLPDGHVALVAYEYFADNPGVLESVIQEQDEDGQVVFQWRSRDHVPFAEGLVSPNGDYAHINSLQVTADGDFLASFRNTSQILKIARRAHDGYDEGEVIWRLGGLANEFTFVDDPYGGPCAQHTAYELANGNLLVFDNGAAYEPASPFAGQTGDICPDPEDPGGPRIARPQSRVAEYVLDEEAQTATLVWSHEVTGRFTPFAGSSQRLANGNTLIGWASDAPVATEVDADGQVVWSLSATLGYLTYRAFRFPAPDAIAPVVTVSTPVDGQVYGRDQVVDLDLGCTDRGGSTLATCTADSTVPGRLDTATPGEHTLTVTGTDGAGNTTTESVTYRVGAGAHQPDAWLKRAHGSAWKGQDRYGTDGSGQQITFTVRNGRTATARVRVQNDGTQVDDLVVRGSRNTHQFRLRYRSGGRDVTDAVRAGTFVLPAVEPGRSVSLTIEITAVASSLGSPEQAVRLTASSAAEPDHRDVVVALARKPG